MNGKIVAYSADVNAGLILCQNSERYYFNFVDFTSRSVPSNGDRVEFDLKFGHALKVGLIEKESDRKANLAEQTWYVGRKMPP